MKVLLFSIVLSIILTAFALLNVQSAEAARVRGYFKPSTGSYVQPYNRTSPNSLKFDNYSSQGNYNPYTGKKGYKRW